MNKRLALMVAVTATTLTTLGLSARAETDQLIPTPPTQAPCQEDDACWDCNTMGNRICGTYVGYVCFVDVNGTIQIYTDPEEATGHPIVCP